MAQESERGFEQCVRAFIERDYPGCAEAALGVLEREVLFELLQLLLISLQRLKDEGAVAAFAARYLEPDVGLHPWERVLLRLTHGQVGLDEVLSHAVNDTQRCQARYYDGARLLCRGENAEALRRFDACVAAEVQCWERLFAQAERDSVVREALRRIAPLNQQIGSLHQQGRCGQAIPLGLEACEIARRELGEGHPHYASTLNNLAELYQGADDPAAAEPLYRQAIATSERALGADHPDLAAPLINFAEFLRKRGDHAGAAPLYRRAVDIRSKGLGDHHPHVCQWLAVLAGTYQALGDGQSAEQFSRRLCDALARGQGEGSLPHAMGLSSLASVLVTRGDHAAAEPPLRQALEVFRARLGEIHPSTQEATSALADLLQTQDRLDEAAELHRRLAGAWERLAGPGHPGRAVPLHRLALIEDRLGRDAEAEAHYRAVVDLLGGETGPDNAARVQAWLNLAGFYRHRRRPAEAEPLYRRAAAAAGDGPAVAEALFGAADCCWTRGDSAEAVALLEQVVGIRRAALGPNDPHTAEAVRVLANIQRRLGNYAAAVPLLEDLVRLERETAGEGHPGYATSLHNLAAVLLEMGDARASLPLLEQERAIVERLHGKESPPYAATLDALGTAWLTAGMAEKAEEHYRQAVRIRGAGDEGRLATSLSNLGSACMRQQKFEEALGPLTEAADLLRRAGEPRLADLALNQLTLASLHHLRGDFPAAAALFEQTIPLLRRTHGDSHPQLALALGSWALARYNTGDPAATFPILAEAAAVQNRVLLRALATGSQAQRALCFRQMRGPLDALLTLVLEHLADSPAALLAAWDAVLRQKMVNTESVAIQTEALRRCEGAVRVMADELADLRRQIAEFEMAGPVLGREALAEHLRRTRGEVTPEEVERALHRIDEDEELKQVYARAAGREFAARRERREREQRLEAELVRSLPPGLLEERLGRASAAEVARRLPDGTALVEFVRFRRIEFRSVVAAGGKLAGPEHYLAFVVPAGQPDRVRAFALGEAAAIDRLIAAHRTGLTHDPEGDRRRGLKPLGEHAAPAASPPLDAGAALCEAVFRPLRAALGDCRRLFLAPDGELARLPFEVLPTRAGRWLIDDYAFSYVTVGRDLLRFRPGESGTSGDAVVIADPDFDLGSTGCQRPRGDAEAPPFPGLPGTAVEAELVAGRLKVTPWLAEAALKSRLKGVKSPRVLHVATHGFFLENFAYAAFAEEGFHFYMAADHALGGRFSGVRLASPLLRSGLALAGANVWMGGGTPPAEAGDGLLTAEDVAGMDLSGTEMAVLSACETGLGEISRGDGVLGLRQAFVLAGAQSLVLSLWKVPDLATAVLMDRFYQNVLTGGLGRSEALREAQLYTRDVTVGQLREFWLRADVAERLAARNEPLRQQLAALSRQADQARPFHEPLHWGAFICQGNPAALARTPPGGREREA